MSMQSYINSFLKTSDFKTQKLAGDAGSRVYYRLTDHENKTYILMDYSDDQKSINDFLDIQNLLTKNQISCPKIISHSKEDKLLIIEDLTDYSLEEAFNENKYFKYYEQAILNLTKLHNLNSSVEVISSRAFDYEKLFWEAEFAIKHLNSLFEISDTSATKELSEICKSLSSLPKVICHRDFHSRNIIIKNDQAYFIDFQDARMGPWQYDVVSLLHDSYISLSIDETDKLLKLYLKNINFKLLDNWKDSYRLQLIQRTFKACGSFASLKNLKGTDRYLEYLPICLNLLRKETHDFKNLNKYITNICDSDKGIIK